MTKLTYEQSVKWLRSQVQHSDLVNLCYLDEDNILAAKRFSKSEEFSEVEKLLKLCNFTKKFKILDLGCGNGIASYAFASNGHDVTAVDPDLSYDIGLGATSKLSSILSCGSISTLQGFAEALPLDDSTFDIVYARQSLHHFSDLQKGLLECSRVLKKGGLFLATREHVVNDNKQLNEFLDGHILHQWHGGENAYSVDAYKLAINKAGFTILKCLAPFDSVINHFPASVADIRSWLTNWLDHKIGKKFTPIFLKFTLIETIYRWRLSQTCNSAGRLYSFLCIKK